MRNFLAVTVIAALLAVAYAVSPLWIALDMRRAVMEGDRATLETRVDWAGVRESLKSSLVEIERAKQAEAGRPSLWQRIKAAASPARYAEQLIDRYVTADGVASLAAQRGNLQALLGRGARSEPGEIEIPEHARPLVDRAQRFWARIKRLEFTSLTSLDIEMADRRVPARSYLGTLAFAEGRWKIISVRVLGEGF